MKNIFSLFLFALICSVGFAQQNNIFRIDSLPPQGILLDKGWRWHAGDNPDFAKADFDDSAWESIDPTKDIIEMPQIPLDGQAFWLRCKFSVDSSSFQPMIIQLEQSGATQIFLDGKRIHSFGDFTKGNIKALTPSYVPLSCPIYKGGQYVLSVRYVCQPNIHYAIHFANTCALFKLQFFTPQGWYKAYKWKQYDRSLNIVVSSFFICLCLLFFVFYSFFLKNPSNLYFALYALMYGLPYFFYGFFFDTSSVAPLYWLYTLNIVFGVIGYISIQTALHSQFHQNKGIVYWLFVVLGLISIPISLKYYRGWEFYGIVVNFLGSFAIMWLGIRGIKQQKRGASIIAVGGGFFFIFWIGFLFTNSFSSQTKDFAPFLYALAQISIPIATAIFVGYDLAQTNISLQQQLDQNERLSSEKQQILTTQNETLERQVAERTSELEHKNRDLEIEGALDKIRSTSLAMRHSDELENVVAVLFEKLKELGLVFDGGTGIHLFNEGSKDAIIWVFAPFQPPTKINLPYDEAAFEDNNIILDVWQAHETGNHIVNKTYSFEEKNKYFNYVFKHNDATQVPEEARHFILSLPSYTASFIAEKHSLLGANSWTGQCFSEIEFEILRRMARVFEQAYTRFLDLQKAEAQAREAQIEAALERVRSASLAIHQSHELEKVVVVLFDKLNELGVPFDSAFIYFFEKSTRNIEAWVATKQLSAPIKVNMPYDESVANNPILVDLWYAFENGEHGLNKSYKEKDKDDYYRYEAKHNPSLIPASVTDLQLEAECWTTTFASEKNSIVGFDSWNGHLTTIEDFQLLKRFAKVFEQAYIRFLDLQKAEAQAREAQIEAALERVRSRTMSMYSSTELREVVATIYDQLQHLGFTNGALGIVIMDNPSGDMDWWMAGFGKENYPENYYIPYFDHPFYLAQLNAWKQGQKYVTIEVSGQSKKAYDEVIFSKTGFVRIPLETQKIMSNFEQITFSNANMKYGALSWGIEPLDNDHVQILQRFAVVFEQTYTRFLDLQKKEEQAVKLAEEKQKLEKTLNELRSTQAQLIQKEKLASLGELTAGIAHEIQNPLNFVNNFSELSVELIEEAPLPPEGEYDENWIPQEAPPGGWGPFFDDLRLNLQKINLHGKRASSIVKGMLEHARASTGIKEWTDINALADEYLRLAYNGTRAKNGNFEVAIETHFAPNLPTLDVIPQDIGRVLLNLINNAFWAVKTVEKPKVVVKTEQMENQIMITVKDNGIGMSDQIKAKIFQPFFTTKPTGEGTGLGLSLAYDIVTKGHGGTIEVESLEGEGTTFTVKLPILT